MTVSQLVRSIHHRLTPYHSELSDLPIEELKQRLNTNMVYKLSFNENPLGPSKSAVLAMKKAIENTNLYPSSGSDSLRKEISMKEGVTPEQVIISNGADEMINLAVQTFLESDDEVVIPELTFGQYLASTNLMGAKPVFAPMGNDLQIDLTSMLELITNKTKMLFLCNPNNPTGLIIPFHELEAFLRKIPNHILVVIDEAYHEYANSKEYKSAVDFTRLDSQILVIRTFSKIYSLAAARVGYGIGKESLIKAIEHVRPPFNVNGIAQEGAIASIKDENHLLGSRTLNEEGKKQLYKAFEQLNIFYLRSETNFVYFDMKKDKDDFYQFLLGHGIVLRKLSGNKASTALRITVGKSEDMAYFIEKLQEYMKNRGKNR